MHERKQFNVYLPTDLIKAVKRAALEADQSLSLFVEETLRARVEQGIR
jgi:predicted HicB family RNase H-like nuclease